MTAASTSPGVASTGRSTSTETDRLLYQAAKVMRSTNGAGDLPQWAVEALEAGPPPKPQREPKAPKVKAPRPPKAPKPQMMDYPRRPRGRPPKVKQPDAEQVPMPPRKRGRPPGPGRTPRPAGKACIDCGVVKKPRAFHRHRTAADGRLSCCCVCIANRRRARRIERQYPACAVLGVKNAKNGLRDLAREWGCDSAFELEVAARLHSLGIGAAREGAVYQYRDAAGRLRFWRPDFTTPSGVAIEVKGRLFPNGCAKIEAVLASNPDLDLRLVFQDPDRPAGKGKPTPAAWADGIDVRWTTLSALHLITMDLPRVVLADDGDRVIDGHQDHGKAATRKATALWPPG